MVWTDTKTTGSTLTAVEYNNLANHVRPTATATVAKSEPADYVTTNYGSDDACIQAAIDYVNGLGGGSVLIREGTYIIENSIMMKNNILLIGTGWNTILQSDNSLNNHIIDMTAAAHSNMIFSNFKMDGNSSNNTLGTMLYVRQCTQLLIDKIYFNDGTVRNLYVTDSANVIIDKCISNLGAECGLQLTTTTKSIISKCIVKNAGQWGIYTYDCEEVQIVNNNIYNTTLLNSEGFGIGVYNTNYNLIVNNNIIDTVATKGISIQGLLHGGGDNSNILVNNNIVRNTDAHGIIISKTAYASVENNRVYNSGNRAIYVIDGDFSSVKNNIINTTDENYGHGIQIESSDSFIVTGNIIKNLVGTNSDSININGSNYGIISINYCDGRTRYNIKEESTSNNNIISSNIFKDSQFAKGGANTITIDNIGYNPVGAVGPPSVPATTVNYTNTYGYPCQVQVYGGTVTEIDIDDIATGLTSGIFIIPPGGTINITYSAAPSWRWWGL